MGFFSSLFKFAVSAVATVISVVSEVADAAVDAITREFNEYKEKWKDYDIEKLKRQRFEQLGETNNEIIELDRKKRRDGRLTSDDEHHLLWLIERRNKLRGKIEAAKEYELANDIVDHSGDYDINLVDPGNPNELTRLGGQVVIGKVCGTCSRPMAIRWPTAIQNPTIIDLFWGCTGYFVKDEFNHSSCKHSERFSQEDMRLFGHIGKPGMELQSENLNKIVKKAETASHIKVKLKEAVNELSEDYLCPLHHEKMKLQTKQNASDILDLYYMRCPRCDQTIKIKSATQLDAVLESFNDSGLFSA